MDNVLTVAIAKHFGKLEKDITLHQGEFHIDTVVTLEIKGSVKKGQGSDATPTVEIPLIATMALLMKKMGFQREKAAEILRECMIESLQMKENPKPDDKTSAELIAERIADAEAAIAFVKESVLARLPKTSKAGPTNVKVVVKELVAVADPEPEPAAA
jgi:hypothetical protein